MGLNNMGRNNSPRCPGESDFQLACGFQTWSTAYCVNYVLSSWMFKLYLHISIKVHFLLSAFVCLLTDNFDLVCICISDSCSGTIIATVLSPSPELVWSCSAYVTCLFQCFVFDKFEPYETEEDLVVASLKYTEEQKLWAGTVYLHFRVV